MLLLIDTPSDLQLREDIRSKTTGSSLAPACEGLKQTGRARLQVKHDVGDAWDQTVVWVARLHEGC